MSNIPEHIKKQRGELSQREFYDLVFQRGFDACWSIAEDHFKKKYQKVVDALKDARYSTQCEGIVDHECRYEGEEYIPCPAHGRIDAILKDLDQ